MNITEELIKNYKNFLINGLEYRFSLADRKIKETETKIEEKKTEIADAQESILRLKKRIEELQNNPGEANKEIVCSSYYGVKMHKTVLSCAKESLAKEEKKDDECRKMVAYLEKEKEKFDIELTEQEKKLKEIKNEGEEFFKEQLETVSNYYEDMEIQGKNLEAVSTHVEFKFENFTTQNEKTERWYQAGKYKIRLNAESADLSEIFFCEIKKDEPAPPEYRFSPFYDPETARKSKKNIHPHINESEKPCFGEEKADFRISITKFFEEGEYFYILIYLRIFLQTIRAGYSYLRDEEDYKKRWPYIERMKNFIAGGQNG